MTYSCSRACKSSLQLIKTRSTIVRDSAFVKSVPSPRAYKTIQALGHTKYLRNN